MNEHLEKLYLELSTLENQGITIWLEGSKSDSKHIAKELCIHEETSYMRDYIFDQGVLKEVHFDKIKKTTNNQLKKTNQNKTNPEGGTALNAHLIIRNIVYELA